MAITVRSIPFVYAHVRFASDAREVMHLERYSLEIVALVSGVSEATISALLSGQHKNPEMKTFLCLCNALDLNPINYFDLVE